MPIPPELVRLIRWHVDQFGTEQDGRIFRSVNGNPISPSTYSRVWSDARLIGLSPVQRGSVLLGRPYDLRHAGVTVRLYAGVPERQVADWAGHSVEVLRRVYSKILDGFDDTWFEKIDKVNGTDPMTPRACPGTCRGRLVAQGRYSSGTQWQPASLDEASVSAAQTRVLAGHKGAPGRNRTCGTRFRKPLLYPLSYEGLTLVRA